MTTTDYTQAPSTALLATRCVACGRPLVDAASVEVALGPTCRERFGVPEGVHDDVRREANGLINQIATGQATGTTILAVCDRLRDLGLAALASKVADRTVAIRILDYRLNGADGYLVISPYSEEAIARFREVDGRRFVRDPAAGAGWFFPLGSRNALWRAVQACYQGEIALGPRGAFVV